METNNRWTDPLTLALLGASAGMLDPRGGTSEGFRNALAGLQSGNIYVGDIQQRNINAAQHAYNTEVGQRKLAQLDHINNMFDSAIRGGTSRGGNTQPLSPPQTSQQGGKEWGEYLPAFMALRASGGADLLPYYKTLMGGVKQEAGNYYIDSNNNRQFLPKPIEGATINPDLSTSPIPNAAAINAQYKGAETEAIERAKAAHDLVTQYNPDTDNLENLSRAQALDNRGIANKRPEDVLYDSEVAKNSAIHYNNLQTADMQAPAKLAKYQRLSDLLKNHDGGKLSNFGTELASVANSLGMKVDKNLSNKEAARSISFELGTMLRDPSNGGGLPGTITERELGILLQAAPNMSQSKEGREKLIDVSTRLIRRQQDVARMAREWQKRYKRIDRRDEAGKTFYDYLNQYTEDNPIFDKNHLNEFLPK